jgi:alpha-D-ribose 1-methylphosphonate 5-triphosphate synthase subunit PhnH
MSASPTLAAFANPVLDAQAAFRALLAAMSRPGTIQTLAALPETPAGLSPAAAALLLTLVDPETPLALAAGPAALDWVTFHCGAKLVAPQKAHFVLDAGCSLLDLDAGTDEEPEQGATMLLEVEALVGDSGWRLTGPGVRGEARLCVVGAPPDFLANWAANQARFPRGVDVILCAGSRIAALPRSLKIARE